MRFSPAKCALFGKILLSLLIVVSSFAVWAAPAVGASTTSVVITKYASDGTTVLSQTTIDWVTMQSTLPVQGDGVTHYYHQGPSFDPANLWDTTETVNLKDQGAIKGTDLKDLCNLVGGMSAGDTVQVKATDNFNKTFDYANVYNPQDRQGKIVVCWYNQEFGNATTWADAMQLVFLARTTNGAGQYVFGNWDMHECLPSNRWHYWYDSGTLYPSSNGYTVKYINQINIYSTIPAPTPTPTQPDWDLNGDHVCNIGDVVKIGLVWGQTGSAGWILEDVNNDGVINIGDVVVIGLHWGQTW